MAITIFVSSAGKASSWKWYLIKPHWLCPMAILYSAFCPGSWTCHSGSQAAASWLQDQTPPSALWPQPFLGVCDTVSAPHPSRHWRRWPPAVARFVPHHLLKPACLSLYLVHFKQLLHQSLFKPFGVHSVFCQTKMNVTPFPPVPFLLRRKCTGNQGLWRTPHSLFVLVSFSHKCTNVNGGGLHALQIKHSRP